ncbi:hypothetical protein LCGC14_2946460 [marine sediment metagenome]|uniref:Uncharacterized protein n=1 Tax=marine sediment metagenome TaxID=412755 RepID=A0A0F8Y3L5_9ZZZZ
MYSEMAESHPSLVRGQVWCRTCRRTQQVDSAECLQSGWPKCCGHTMTIDHPDTWVEKGQTENG